MSALLPSDDLAPCPMCASRRIDAAGVQVMCENCGVGTSVEKTLAEAIAAWNRRTAPAVSVPDDLRELSDEAPYFIQERDDDMLICGPDWQCGSRCIARRPKLASNDEWRPTAQAIVDALIAARNRRSAPVGDEEAGRIADTVLDWMIKYDLLDADNEYYASDVLAVLNDLAPSPAPSLPSQEDVARVIDPEAVLGVVDQIRHQNWKSGGVLTMDRDEAADAILALMCQTGDGWLPIESAPKDGTEFQAWLGYWEPKCRINPETEAFEIWGRVDYDMDGWDIYPDLTATHWRPLPAPPAKEGR